MHAANDRPEFAPPPEPALLRAFVLAVLAHLLLVYALMHGLQWKRDAQDAAVEAELWSALPQQAAPKAEPVPPPPPPPPPQPVVKAPPEPPVKSQADIALEREKHQRELERERRQAELEHERALKARAEAQKKREEELARRKEQQQKLLAEARRKEDERKARQEKLEKQAALEEKKRQQLREENMKRMQGMAGTGAPSATGTAARSSGPSASWAGRVQARVRPNIVFSDSVSGNPEAQVEVRLGPGGLIIGKPRLVRSSGVASWDEAVIRALEKTESLPADTDGRYPSPVVIVFKPRS